MYEKIMQRCCKPEWARLLATMGPDPSNGGKHVFETGGMWTYLLVCGRYEKFMRTTAANHGVHAPARHDGQERNLNPTKKNLMYVCGTNSM